MNKELALRTFAYLIGHYKTHEETIINSQEIEAINYILDENERLENQLKKQKEIIDKTRKFLKDEGQKQYNIHDNYRGKWYSPDELDILNKILEDKEV
nr:MAG TPA: hypothetical protein [Caudoviricetes sp.]